MSSASKDTDASQASQPSGKIGRDSAQAIALENASVSPEDTHNIQTETNGDNGIPI